MSDWMKNSLQKITLKWMNVLMFKKRKTGAKRLTVTGDGDGTAMVPEGENKRAQIPHNRSVRRANRDFLNYCDRVYMEQNDCAWRCVQQGHQHQHPVADTRCTDRRQSRRRTDMKKRSIRSSKRNTALVFHLHIFWFFGLFRRLPRFWSESFFLCLPKTWIRSL